MLLCCLLIYRDTRGGEGLGVELLGLPYEVLEQVALVLGQHQILGLPHHLADVSDQRLALS